VAEINPDCRVHVREEWFTLEEGHAVLAGEASAAAAARQAAGGAGAPGGFAVLDAIDSYVEKYSLPTNPSTNPAATQLPPIPHPSPTSPLPPPTTPYHPLPPHTTPYHHPSPGAP